MRVLIICSKNFYYKIKDIKSILEKNNIEVFLPNCYDDPTTEQRMREKGKKEHQEFKSKMYNKLPTTIEEARKKKKQIDPDKDLFKEDNDDKDGFDLSSWSPLRELYDQMPSFVAGA